MPRVIHFVICLMKKKTHQPLFPKNGSYILHVFKNCQGWVGVQTATLGSFELAQM